VFSAVADELVRCLGVYGAAVLRFDADDAAIVVAAHTHAGQPGLDVGERLTLDGENVAALALRTKHTARIDGHDNMCGSFAVRMDELAIHSRVAAPIVVGDDIWGVAVAISSPAKPMPVDTESRIADFADLVATGIAAATARADLIASRARIVAAADDARRRIERDLHDGAQQRLISLGLKLRMAHDCVPVGLDDLKSELSEAVLGLTDVSKELQEMSRGIHPAILAQGGLVPALQTLARRSAIPVSLEAAIDQRLPDSVEVTTYFVLAEALANTAKHAQASEVMVRARTTEDSICLSIHDDGVGGADSANGSGLIGLKDRVEVLGGRMRVTSPAGQGTSIHVTIPLTATNGHTDTPPYAVCESGEMVDTSHAT
jgi:signal transduction histidine kinase